MVSNYYLSPPISSSFSRYGDTAARQVDHYDQRRKPPFTLYSKAPEEEAAAEADLDLLYHPPPPYRLLDGQWRLWSYSQLKMALRFIAFVDKPFRQQLITDE